MLRCRLELSPSIRNLGGVACATTVSRTITSFSPEPILDGVQACAASRIVPLNGGQRERHLRVAVRIGLERAGIDRERRFRERPAAHVEAAFVAAGADHAAHALHAVDELAVKVAHLKARGGAGRRSRRLARASCTA